MNKKLQILIATMQIWSVESVFIITQAECYSKNDMNHILKFPPEIKDQNIKVKSPLRLIYQKSIYIFNSMVKHI